MRKTTNNLVLLGMIFAVTLITANVASAKLFYYEVSWLPFPLICTVGALSYAITYLVTDIVGELWGPVGSNMLVRYGFVCQLISSVLIMLMMWMNPQDPEMQFAYEKLLGLNGMFVGGSLVAYLCSQSWDVFVFHKIRNYVMKKTNGKGRGMRWIWNNGSTMTSQFIDTLLFNLIPFGFGFGYLWTPEGRANLVAMVITQYLFKCFLALCDTPFFYWFTREVKTK